MKPLVFLAGLVLLAVGCSAPVATAPVATTPVINETPALIVVSKELRPGNASRLAAACVRYRVNDETKETCVLIILGDITNDRATECYGGAVVGKPLPESCR